MVRPSIKLRRWPEDVPTTPTGMASSGHWRIGVVALVLGAVLLLAALGPAPWVQAFRHVHPLLEQHVRYADWEQARSEHFRLYYLPEDEPYVPLILAEAEAVYRTFARQFQFVPSRPVPLVLFAHHGQMQQRFGWSAAEKASGVYYGGVIYLLSPRTLWPPDPATALEDAQLARRYHEEGPLFHEYTHWYLDAFANNNFPRWYTEGLAQLVEYEMIGYEWLNDNNRLNRRELYTFRQLDASFDRLENVALAYRQAFKFVQFVRQEHGWEQMLAFHRRLAQGIPFSRAWQDVFGESVEQSYDRWREHVRKGGYE